MANRSSREPVPALALICFSLSFIQFLLVSRCFFSSRRRSLLLPEKGLFPREKPRGHRHTCVCGVTHICVRERTHAHTRNSIMQTHRHAIIHAHTQMHKLTHRHAQQKQIKAQPHFLTHTLVKKRIYSKRIFGDEPSHSSQSQSQTQTVICTVQNPSSH